ncbi:MAG: type 1 glutamine amidotransferase domain-containing protein [Alphaproteobacteria bacterium]
MPPVKVKFLFVLTSHDQLGDTGEKTGFHFSEMSDPYYILEDHGVEVDIASIKGGEPPVDPNFLKDPADSVTRFKKDAAAMKKLKSTKKIDDVDVKGYEGIFLPGGHGTMWDFPESKGLQNALEKIWKQEKIIAAICHGAAGFVKAKDTEGQPLIKNHRINCFTDEEERKVKKDKVVPFLLETKLHDLGAIFEHAEPFQAIVVDDGRIITGQNPASTELVANTILRAVGISPYIDQKQSKDEAA